MRTQALSMEFKQGTMTSIMPRNNKSFINKFILEEFQWI